MNLVNIKKELRVFTFSTRLIFLLGLILLSTNAYLFIKNNNWNLYNNLSHFFLNPSLNELDIERFNLVLSTQDNRKLRSWKLLNNSKDVDRKSFQGHLCRKKNCTKVKVSSKGDLKKHWEDKRKSYRFRLEDNSFLRADEVDFTLASDRYFENELLANILARKLELPILPIHFEQLSINNSYQTLYLMSYRYTKLNLEKYLRFYTHTLKLKNLWLPHIEQSNLGTFYYGFKEDKFIYNSWRNYSQLYSISPIRKINDVQIRWSSALECLRNQCDEFDDFFNIEHFAKWFSLLSVFGSYHASLGDNLIFIYNSADKKFSPVLNDVLLREIKNYEQWVGKMKKGNDFINLLFKQDKFKFYLNLAFSSVKNLDVLNIREGLLKLHQDKFYQTNESKYSIENGIKWRHKTISKNLETIKLR